MATAIKRRDEHVSGDQEPAQHSAAKPRTRRWFLPAALGLFFLVVWLLPVIVAHSPLLNWIVAAAAETAQLKGTVTVQSASLSWLSPPVISGVEVRDERDQPVLDVPRAAGEKSLVAMLFDRNNLGRFRLQQPKLTLVLRQDGSNLEDVLSELLRAPEEPSSSGVGLSLEITDGSVSIVDPKAQTSWQIDDLRLVLSVPAGEASPLDLKTSGVVADPGRPGEFAAELKMQVHGAASESPPAGEATVSTKDLPLAMFSPLARRFSPGTEVAGRLTSAIRCQFGEMQKRGQAPFVQGTRRAVPAKGACPLFCIEGNLSGEDLLLAAPPLGADRLKLDQIQAACKIALEDDFLTVESLAMQSDVGKLAVSGTLSLGEEAAEDPLEWLPRQICQIDGHIDLARLASLLPDTLHIRQDTRIVSGHVRMSLASGPGQQGTVWDGKIETGNLTAETAGRRFVWEQPILVALAAHQGDQGPVVESFDCQSTFLKLHAAGTPDDLTASGSFDLNQLAAQLGQFVDLGGLSLSGDGWAELAWKRSPQQVFETDARLHVRSFQFSIPDRLPWKEQSLAATLAASGQTDFTADSRLDTASLVVTAGSDQPDWVDLRLTAPVAGFHGGGSWPVELRSQGEIARWIPRIAPWVELGPWDLAGSYRLTTGLTGSADSVKIANARLIVDQLQVRGAALNVVEPRVELTASGDWDQSARRLALKSANLTSGSVSAQATDVVLALPPDGSVELSGSANYRGSLQRLGQLITTNGEAPAWTLAGQVSGNAQFQQSGDTIAATFQTVVDDLVAAHRTNLRSVPGQRVEEKQIHLAGRGRYNTQSRSLELEEATLSCQTLAATAKGRCTSVEDRSQLEVDGKIHYDMAKLSELIRTRASEVHLAGGGSSPIWYRGPLAWGEAQAGTSLSWTEAEVYGFRIGPGQLQATLAGGAVQIRPMELDASEGRLHLAPRVRLAPEPMEVTLPPGPLVEQVRINPRMCASALQYIAPVLAGVTTAEGRFSIELARLRIPLDDPAAGDVAGRMTIHSAQIGPGPLVHELAVVLGRAGAAELSRESVIAFQMVEGRVYHQGLELVFPELTIRTHGWVGLDKSLGLMAEMPVPRKWLGSNQVLDATLRNQTIRLPISGSLDKPKIDRKVVDQLSRQFITGAAQNVLENELNKGLQRLLGPQR